MSANIDQLDSSKPLAGPELREVLDALSLGEGLSPLEVERLLKLDPESARPLGKIDIIYPIAAVVVYAIIRTIFETYPEIPKGIELPLWAHNFLQALWALNANAADSAAVIDHLPYIALLLGGIWGLKNTLPKFLRGDSFVDRVTRAQAKVADDVAAGEMRYRMQDHHTAAFVGSGDPLADTLQKEKGLDMVMKYADLPLTDKVWQLIPSSGNHDQIFQALDRADFSQAGEVLILPVKADDMILPGPDGHDMSLDEIAAKIKISAKYCRARNIDQKRILVVGDLEHEENYSTRTSENEAAISIKTLKQLLSEVQADLLAQGMPVEIIAEDTTKDAIAEVIRLAGGRKIEYHATRQSDERYGLRFYQELNLGGYQANPDAKGTSQVFYNLTDVPTEMNIDPDDIAIILDKSVKDRLMAAGFKPENVICPAERMQAKLFKVVDET
jgi:hypothetical protein